MKFSALVQRIPWKWKYFCNTSHRRAHTSGLQPTYF